MDQTPLARYAESLRASGSGASLGLERTASVAISSLRGIYKRRQRRHVRKEMNHLERRYASKIRRNQQNEGKNFRIKTRKDPKD